MMANVREQNEFHQCQLFHNTQIMKIGNAFIQLSSAILGSPQGLPLPPKINKNESNHC